jgi:hypothetical protein
MSPYPTSFSQWFEQKVEIAKIEREILREIFKNKESECSHFFRKEFGGRASVVSYDNFDNSGEAEGAFALCLRCGKYGPRGDNCQEAIQKFWEQETKEKNMNTEDYKRGVEDATKPLERPLSGSGFFKIHFDAEVEKRRKSLLTKKITKWAAWYNNGGQGFPIFCVYQSWDMGKKEGTTRLWNSEREALDYVSTPDFNRPVGVFPFEIEIPL